MSSILDPILNLPPLAAYAVVAALVFSEAALFVGFVLPGETAVVLGGVLASQGTLSLPVLMAVVVVAAVLGDSVGYEVGRRFGEPLLQTRPLRRHAARLDGARQFLGRRGGPAVFLGRWTAFLRAVLPALAGLSRLPYRTFLAYNAAGGLVWGVAFCLVGYLAGHSYRAVEQTIGRGAAVVTAVVLVVGIVVGRRRRRHEDTSAPAA